MKQIQYSFYISFMAIILAFSAACVTTPPLDTAEKQLAAAEISWKHTLLTVEKNINRMSNSQRDQVARQLIKINKAMDAARLAVKLADGNIDFSSNLATVNSGLGVVRTILEELEQKENT